MLLPRVELPANKSFPEFLKKLERGGSEFFKNYVLKWQMTTDFFIPKFWTWNTIEKSADFELY